MIKRLLSFVLPPICVLCRFTTRTTSNVCEPCRETLPSVPYHCPQCAKFHAYPDHFICGDCLNTTPPFDRTFALFPYDFPVMQLIVQLKFWRQLSHAQLFSDCLLNAIRQRWYHATPLPDLILPVPLHPARLRERGFNQTLEIAKPIAKQLNIPLDTTGLLRTKATLAQSSLSNAKERLDNIANAFTVTRDYQHLTIALLDDVITTGYTITECSRILKKHGAARIDVWCCARRG